MADPISLSHRVGGWLPRDHNILKAWLDKTLEYVERHPTPFVTVIQEFQELIEGDTVIFMLFHQMFEQIPYKPPYHQDPTHQCQVRNYMWMLRVFNCLLTKAPEFNDTGLVGFPFNAVLDWPMATEGGYVAFLEPRVNKVIRKMLNEWAVFLTSPASTSTLNADPGGWFSTAAQQEMPDFVKDYKCSPDEDHWGFQSWDEFFTREFKPDIRPVEYKTDDHWINNACESAPYKISTDVKPRDRFWIKAQLYSLNDMFANNEIASQFVGGTVYQAFLSALSYHRWHSPINGVVKKKYNIPGTYYSETPVYGFNSPDGPDPAGPNDSQGYITAVAARAVILIECDDPFIGTMGFVAVGMAEVSSCEVTVEEGQRVEKGDQLGMFHFGGSTHCLIFRPGIEIEWHLNDQEPSLDSTNINLNVGIGHVKNAPA